MALNLTFRNGKSIEALLWSWKPEIGLFEALNESNGQVKKYHLRDLKSGIIFPTRDRHTESGEDLIQKALSEGWDRS